MALTDVNFQEGEGQDYIVELPSVSYVGSLADVVVEAGGTQYPVAEIPAAGGSRIFVISE